MYASMSGLASTKKHAANCISRLTRAPLAMNKYLQHIIRKTNKNTDSLASCVSAIQAKKKQDLQTYLFLVQKRLKL